MPQKNIWDFYSICKKKLDRLHLKKLNLSKKKNVDAETTRRINNNNDKLDNELRMIKNDKITKLQPKFMIDNETRQIILRSNTIIDQTKSPIKNSDFLKDDFIFKKPSSPAPKMILRRDREERKQLNVSLNQKSFSDFKPKRSLELDEQLDNLKRLKQFKSAMNLSNDEDDQLVNNENTNQVTAKNECKVRKRLFDFDEKIQTPNDAFLNKLKDFQQKSSISNRLNVSFYSPSKRAKEQALSSTKSKESIIYSPKKFLESKLNLSPSTTKSMTENSPPPKTFTNLSINCSFNSSPQKSTAFNLSSLNCTSPFKSPIKPKVKNEFSSPSNLPEAYLELAKVFFSLEKVIAELFNQSKLAPFERIRRDFQKLTNTDFDLKALAQIISIYPNAYKLSWNKSTNKTNYELIIKPNILSNKVIPFTLQIRNNEFSDRLFQFAKKAHNDYLLSLDKSINLKCSREMTKWHSDFQFPNIPEAKLPELSLEQTLFDSPKKDLTGKLSHMIDDDDIEIVFDSDDEIEIKA